MGSFGVRVLDIFVLELIYGFGNLFEVKSFGKKYIWSFVLLE